MRRERPRFLWRKRRKRVEYNRSGLLLVASGDDYLKIEGIEENSPASAAGLQVGDVFVSINKRPADAYTLSSLHEMFQEISDCDLVVAREGKHLNVHLRPRSRI